MNSTITRTVRWVRDHHKHFNVKSERTFKTFVVFMLKKLMKYTIGQKCIEY